MFFHTVSEGQPDPIFGLAAAFKADTRPNKIDLLMGIYKNESLQTELMPSVQQAKQEIFSKDLLADYLPIDGSQELVESLGALLFGTDHWKSSHDRIYGGQTIGGTGALRAGAEFVAQEIGKTIYIPQPTWPNHRSIFERAGCRVETYPYYDSVKRFDIRVFLTFLEQVEPRSTILLHAVCHNPTGYDPSKKEWEEIARLMRKRQLLPFFDCAYQGLGDGIEEDAQAIRQFIKEGLEFLVAYSCSKNFTLYCQRVGALFIVNENAPVKLRVASQVKRIIRALYSNPPAHGGRIVTHILTGLLRKSWEEELDIMRERIQSMRCELIHRLMKQAKMRDFRPLLQNKGMFSFIDLEKSQVQELIDRYAIYMPDNGRINITGLNESNLDRVIENIVMVMRSS